MSELHAALDNLINKYKTNEYVTSRIEIYMKQLLPAALDNANKDYMQRLQRKQTLNQNRVDFVERFLHKNKFYYCLNSKLFINYDGLNYKTHSEDDIHHKILTTITAEKNLVPWKHRISKQIFYAIKQRSPLQTIPESPTIQKIINILCPKLFTSRYMVKYFLTLLGDNILNKEDTRQIYIISLQAKEIIQEMGFLYNQHFSNNNIVHNIKYKYYDHDYSICRLLNINKDYIEKYKELSNELSKNIIEVFAVGTYYSTRYQSADKFLNQCVDTETVNHILYLKQNTQENIVDKFLHTSIEECNGSNIETKNILFIWKKFLKENNLPSVMFNEVFKKILQNKINYCADTDMFTNITSISLPLVSSFIKFWDETIVDDPNEDDLEIDEMVFLFKKWAKKSCSNLTEQFILDLIRHFYPTIEIEDNKYLLKISNTLWDKRLDVINIISEYKLVSVENKQLLSICSAYKYYISQPNKEYLVSKKFFEKVAMEELGDALDADGFIY